MKEEKGTRGAEERLCLEELTTKLYDLCDRIASKYDVYGNNGRARSAFIIECLNATASSSIAIKMLCSKGRGDVVDGFYGELHFLAVNILTEQLYNVLSSKGLNVAITTEAETVFGMVDIFIEVSKSGINIKMPAKEFSLIVEVKTGNSISFSQIFRYLCSEVNSIVVWRVRRRQVLVFNYEETMPMLEKFLRMICLRGERLLKYNGSVNPVQRKNFDYRPTDKALVATFFDFMEAIDEDLDIVTKAICDNLQGISDESLVST